MAAKTCDKCKHYTPTDTPDIPKYVNAGRCALIGDSNEGDVSVTVDRVSGRDYEGYEAGAYVGPKFGCIHWSKK